MNAPGGGGGGEGPPPPGQIGAIEVCAAVKVKGMVFKQFTLG